MYQMNRADMMVDLHKNEYSRLKHIIENKMESIKDQYIVWFQSRLKNKKSLIDKIEQNKEINDIIGFRIIYPWTSGLYEIASFLESIDELKIIKKEVGERGKTIYLFGITSIGTIYEIQLWPTLLYHCFESEHNLIYKPTAKPTELQIAESEKLRNDEHMLQDIIDRNVLIRSKPIITPSKCRTCG
jgi:hypothetical protein